MNRKPLASIEEKQTRDWTAEQCLAHTNSF